MVVIEKMGNAHKGTGESKSMFVACGMFSDCTNVFQAQTVALTKTLSDSSPFFFSLSPLSLSLNMYIYIYIYITTLQLHGASCFLR